MQLVGAFEASHAQDYVSTLQTNKEMDVWWVIRPSVGWRFLLGFLG